MSIKAVIFDIDGVLLDSMSANLKFFQNLMVKFGYQPPTLEYFMPLFHLTMLDTIKILTKSTSDEEIKKIWEAGRSGEVPYPTDLLSMPAAAPSVIEELAKKYLLGIMTSRVKNRVYIAQLIALQKYFSATISYEDTTNHKPHPEPLLLAAKQLGVKPDEAVYIGDVENDVQTAHAAGMKAIIYSKISMASADANTSDFAKIPEIILNLEN